MVTGGGRLRMAAKLPGVDRTLLRAALGLAAFGVTSAWLLPQVGSLLIEQAYHGESWPIVNDILAGRHVVALEHYLAIWLSIARWVYGTFFAIAVLAAGLSLDPVRSSLGIDPTPGQRRAEPGIHMSRGRLRLANATIGFVLLGSSVALIGDAEIWPFSPYGMYSRIIERDSVEMALLYGVTDSDPPGEILLTQPSQIAPFDHSRLRVGIYRLSFENNPSLLYHEVLARLVRRYRRRLAAGDLRGPELRGARLYTVRWRVDSRATNANNPEERTLLAEWFEPPASGSVR